MVYWRRLESGRLAEAGTQVRILPPPNTATSEGIKVKNTLRDGTSFDESFIESASDMIHQEWFKRSEVGRCPGKECLILSF